MRNLESNRRKPVVSITRRNLAALLAIACAWGAIASEPAEEWKVKRKEVFEFAEKPVVTREGDKVVIVFVAKDYCDATIAIENADGKIVRYLASGVLGPNAPEPFQKDALKQTVTWDGKDELGHYVDDLASLKIRVSLGLKPRYEKTVHWSPHRRSDCVQRGALTVMAAAQEGVYLADQSGTYTRVMLFDHEGNYVRTVYPFAAEKLPEIKDLMWREMPQTGRSYPLRNGLSQATLLTSGSLEYGKTFPTGKGGGLGCTALVPAGSRVLVLSRRMNILTSGGGTTGVSVSGPDLTLTTYVPGIHAWPGGDVACHPQSAALSPDGKWLYLSGYFWVRSWEKGGFNVVMRMPADGSAKPEVFLGTTTTDGGKTPPKDADLPGRFQVAASVDVDPTGRVYVADYGNDRIQIFSSEGKHLKSIPSTRPAIVKVDPRTGEIWAVSCLVPFRFNPQTAKPVPPSLAQLGTFEKPVAGKRYRIDFQDCTTEGYGCLGILDVWTSPPTLWVAPAGSGASWVEPDWKEQCVKVMKVEGDALKVQRDFAEDATKEALYLMNLRKNRIKVFCRESDGALFVAYGRDGVAKSFFRMLQVDPETGAHKLVELPWDTEDLAFDLNDFVYLRTESYIARYDSKTWRETPFDYGIERSGVGFGYEVGQFGKAGSVISGAELPSVKAGGYWHMGGMSVSASGHIAVTCYNATRPADRKMEIPTQSLKEVAKYSPRVFPGRNALWAIHVLDKYGKTIREDAVPGSSQMAGIGIDRNDDIYGLMLGPRQGGDAPYFNEVSCTAFKAKPGVTRVLSTGNPGNGVPIPLDAHSAPKRPPDIASGPLNKAWFEHAEWLYGGVGTAAKYISYAGGGCWCDQTQMTMDYFARSFLPESDTYSIAVLDSEGNLILRIGQYGNTDDGVPMDGKLGPPHPRAIGGDEVALFTPRFLATSTDRRLFVSDLGNFRVLSVKLGYHTEERIALGEIPNSTAK